VARPPLPSPVWLGRYSVVIRSRPNDHAHHRTITNDHGVGAPLRAARHSTRPLGHGVRSPLPPLLRWPVESGKVRVKSRPVSTHVAFERNVKPAIAARERRAYPSIEPASQHTSPIAIDATREDPNGGPFPCRSNCVYRQRSKPALMMENCKLLQCFREAAVSLTK